MGRAEFPTIYWRWNSGVGVKSPVKIYADIPCPLVGRVRIPDNLLALEFWGGGKITRKIYADNNLGSGVKPQNDKWEIKILLFIAYQITRALPHTVGNFFVKNCVKKHKNKTPQSRGLIHFSDIQDTEYNARCVRS